MTATLTAPTAHPTTTRTAVRPVWRTGVGYGLIAAAATTTVAGIAHAAGVSLDVSGEPIPLAGFAQLTFAFTMIGTLLAAVFARRADRPRHTFVVTTLVLTALSIVPDVLADALVSTRITLALTHVVAAAIVIPALSSRLSD
jgi:peptidoglycan/LPS O-acetylase OafA/YrhL